jgi:transcriptional regulator with XRE-family HTH domain
VARSHLAAIEAGTANPTLAVVDRIAGALGVELELRGGAPLRIGDGQPRDRVHAWCSGYAARRLRGGGLLVAREVTIREGRAVGWIDLLAFDPRTGVMLVIEIKTALDDIGRLERQVGWYARTARQTDVAAEWRPASVVTWCLVLATATADHQIGLHRDVLRSVFPVRASSMLSMLEGGPVPSEGSGLALIDPGSRRRDWLIPSRSDGRRSPAPYADVAAAMAGLGGGGRR